MCDNQKPIIVVLAKDPTESHCYSFCLGSYWDKKFDIIVVQDLDSLNQAFREYGKRILVISISIRVPYFPSNINFEPVEIKQILEQYGFEGLLAVNNPDHSSVVQNWEQIGALVYDSWVHGFDKLNAKISELFELILA